jgi:nicotinamide-nucleotide adenylyltransferase
MKQTSYKPLDINSGLIVMRGQPIHNGHLHLITKAIFENDELIIALGSRNKPVSFENPFKVSQRIEMLKRVFGESSKMKILTLADIGTATQQEWVEYVFTEIEKNKINHPHTYYAGDEDNYKWYENCINPFTQKDISIKYVDRLETKIMSGTEIRKSISSGFDSWKKHVPVCLHSFIQEQFPKQYLLSEKLKERK